MLAKSVLLTVESYKLSAFWLSAHNNLMSLNHVSVKAMHRLTVGHHHIVGDVDDVVDRTQADNLKLVLQPFWALLHLAASDAHASITLASLCVLNLHLDRKVVVVYCELRAVGAMKRSGVTIALEPSIKVASHTPMTQGIRTVGCNVNLNHPVALQMIVFSSRLTNGSVFGQHDNAIMTCAHANLVLGTNHAKALNATQFRLLDYKFLVAIIEHAAQVGNYNLLTCSHIRCTANNLLRFCLAKVNGCYMQVV